jgi:hypothetical protein
MTQNGSQSPAQETLALLRIIAMGEEEIAAGKTVPMREAIEHLRSKRRITPMVIPAKAGTQTEQLFP